MNDFSKQSSQLSFDKVSVIYNDDVTESFSVACSIADMFKQKGFQCLVSSSSNFDSFATFAVTVGGDGTLLKAARFYAPLGVPVFGINLGRLGFLAQANPEQAKDVVDKLIAGKYKIQSRMMISTTDKSTIALNDIVVKGDSFSRTSKFYLSVNNKIVCDYLADGVIISTPTGSTAYTLSAGGPVLAPEIEAMVIVPICPHTLNARPLVVPSCDVISVTGYEESDCLKMSADGQETFDICPNGTVTLKKSEIYAKLVIIDEEDNEFYSVLRKKLQWGVAPVK